MLYIVAMKKILGYLFYILAALACFSIYGNILRFNQGAVMKNESTGVMLSIIFNVVLIFVLVKYARKWTKRKV